MVAVAWWTRGSQSQAGPPVQDALSLAGFMNEDGGLHSPGSGGNGNSQPYAPADSGLYAVLGLPPTASDAEIQVAYRRQAARLAGGGRRKAERLRQLNAAYGVIGHPALRVEYDRTHLFASA